MNENSKKKRKSEVYEMEAMQKAKALGFDLSRVRRKDRKEFLELMDQVPLPDPPQPEEE